MDKPATPSIRRAADVLARPRPHRRPARDLEVGDEHARMQALRFGMSEGACVECVTRIPAGPLVLKSGRQEIAVGRALAKRIQVRERPAVATG